VREQRRAVLRLWRQRGIGQLLGDVRTGEADPRADFGDDDVADAGETGCHTAKSGIAQHRDVRHARGRKPRQGGNGARHLHQREDALVHAGAA
jgi:hypothetical protein